MTIAIISFLILCLPLIAVGILGVGSWWHEKHPPRGWQPPPPVRFVPPTPDVVRWTDDDETELYRWTGEEP